MLCSRLEDYFVSLSHNLARLRVETKQVKPQASDLPAILCCFSDLTEEVLQTKPASFDN